MLCLSLSRQIWEETMPDLVYHVHSTLSHLGLYYLANYRNRPKLTCVDTAEHGIGPKLIRLGSVLYAI